MKKLVNNALIALTIIPLLGSCGKSDSGDGIQRDEFDEGSLDGSTIDGQYQAKFFTLNPQVNGTIPGSLTLFRDGDKLMTYVRLFAGKPKAWHMQGIFLGRRCPDLGDDVNRDGFIDIEEAMRATGEMIVPLDANMNSQTAGMNFYPVADLSGYYHYERVASFERMFEDLRKEDKNPDDHIAKLGPDDKFGFTGRVFMVLGVSEDTVLPETVAGLGRRRAFQTLPITCGIIKPSNVTPGTVYTGEIPGPVAEVEEGQDRPAPYEDNTGGASGGTVSGTTGTNDTNDGEVGDQGGATSGETSGGTSGQTRPPRTTGGFIGGFIGGSSGGSTSGGSTSGGSTTGGTTGETTGGSTGETTEEPRRGGFIGGFIGGSSGGSTGE